MTAAGPRPEYRWEQDLAAGDVTAVEMVELLCCLERASERKPRVTLPGDPDGEAAYQCRADAARLAGAVRYLLRSRLGG